MHIIRSTIENYHTIADVWERSVLATHHFLPADFTAITKPLLVKDYLPKVALFHITDDQNAIVGFLGVSEQKIEMLFIHPQSFGKGLGKAMIDFAIHELGATKVDVNEQNEQAVGFYLKMGFKQIGRSEKDGQGNDYPILHLSL
jgi:putative acetyltransferase